MTFTKNMFDAIKTSLSNKNGESSFKEIMKFESGKTYLVRLVPNVIEPKNTIFHYYHHSWKSLSTGQFVTTLCPTTYGESCPIDSYVLKTYNTGSSEEKSKLKEVSRKENWMVNAYVISDPTNPENEGKVKVIRYGKELAKIINNAIDGDDADEFGVKIFDLSDGCTFKIKCESRSANFGGANRMLTTYVSSKFMSPSKLEGIDQKKLDEVYNNVHDLNKFFKPKTQAELQRMLDQHYFCVSDVVEDTTDEDEVIEVRSTTPSPKEVEKNDALNSIFEGIKESSEIPESKPTPPKTQASTDEDDTDAKLKELLAGL
jgi:hypothetical protein